MGGGSEVVSHVDEALTGHATPAVVAGGDAFGCCAAPEEGVLFGAPVRVWVARGIVILARCAGGRGGGVDGFVHVVPGGRVEDVVVGVGFGLGEDGAKDIGGFEGGGGEVEAVKVGQIGLVAYICGEGPVGDELAKGVWGDAACADVRL